MRYEYACRTDDRIEHAKRVIAERASRQGNSIVGYKIERTYVMPFHVAYHLVEGLKALCEHYGLECRGEDTARAA